MAQEHQLTTLDSGVRIVTEAMPSVRSVSLGLWIGTGSRTESEAQAGLSHLLEHLLFKGSSRYSSLEIDQIFDAMGAELSKHAPRIATVQIDPEKIGLLIGKGGETIRGLQEEFEAQIDVSEDGQVLVYAADGERGDALAERIRSMTKDVEIGDEFTGKVVKTTAFGAFVELSKGTDGLLHISNIAPGRRIDTVEEVLNKGDELAVRVVEVDRERGRIGLRLAEDPEVAGKSADELASVGTGDPGPPRRDRGDRGDRGGRDGRGRGGYRDRDRDRGGDRDRGRSRDRDPERPHS